MCRSKNLKVLSFALAIGLPGSPVMAESISVTSTFVSVPVASTCDATAGAGQGGYVTPDGNFRNWSDADSYCTSQGFRLPTTDELVALYNAYPGGQIASVCGWSTNGSYWSSTQVSPGSHNMVNLNNGDVNINLDNNTINVTCVR